MLEVLETTRYLRWTRPGRLMPWLGPALRGLVARRFKARVCRYSPAEQDTTWRYCKGCPHLPNCSYGKLFEPDPPANADVFSGQTEAVRPLVLAPQFPAPMRAIVGQKLALRVLVITNQTGESVRELWDSLREAGADPAGGLDPDRTTFDLLREGAREQRWQVELPLRPDAIPGNVPQLRVELTSPLFVRTGEADEGRRLVLAPSFADLLRAGLRTLGRLCALYDQPLPADFAALKEAAMRVSTISTDYRPYYQPKFSNRSGHRGTLRGVTGSGIYADVPLALARWLLWAGRLHVGTHRIAGAGSWRVYWSDRRDHTNGPRDWHELSHDSNLC